MHIWYHVILSSQASARSGIVGNTANALTAQSAFLNKFKNVVNCRVDIREDIKHYQDTLSYASSKVDCSVAQNIYMLSSDMNLKITVRYNYKILVSDGNFSLGKNVEVNSLELAKIMGPAGPGSHSDPIALEPSIKSYKVVAKPPPGGAYREAGQSQVPTYAKKPTTHEDEKIALVLALAGGFTIWNIFR